MTLYNILMILAGLCIVIYVGLTFFFDSRIIYLLVRMVSIWSALGFQISANVIYHEGVLIPTFGIIASSVASVASTIHWLYEYRNSAGNKSRR